MKKRNIFVILLFVCMMWIGFANQSEAAGMPMSQQQISNILLSYKWNAEFCQGSTWNNSSHYQWDNYWDDTYACAAFAAKLSDKAFGNDCPTHYIPKNNLKKYGFCVGDILVLNGKKYKVGRTTYYPSNEHVMIITSIGSKYITLAEGNLNGKANWKAKLSKKNLLKITKYGLRRFY